MQTQSQSPSQHLGKYGSTLLNDHGFLNTYRNFLLLLINFDDKKFAIFYGILQSVLKSYSKVHKDL